MRRIKKIIIVDDSRSARAIIRRGFEREGYLVLDTDNATAAIRMILDHRPDAVLLDLNIPNLPTLEFVKKLIKLRRDEELEMKLLLYSASKRGELQEIALRCGADGCVEKSGGVERCVADVDAQISKPASR